MLTLHPPPIFLHERFFLVFSYPVLWITPEHKCIPCLAMTLITSTVCSLLLTHWNSGIFSPSHPSTSKKLPLIPRRWAMHHEDEGIKSTKIVLEWNTGRSSFRFLRLPLTVRRWFCWNKTLSPRWNLSSVLILIFCCNSLTAKVRVTVTLFNFFQQQNGTSLSTSYFEHSFPVEYRSFFRCV